MVKIASIEASAHSRPFEGDVLRNALGANIKRDFVLVKVTADDGTVGYGEAHHGQNPTAMAEIIQGGIATLVVGSDPFDTEGIWERVRHQQVQTHGLGAGSVIGLSGIDIALWDLKGKLLGQPVYRLLGGTHKRLRAYVGGLTLGFQPPDSLAAEVGMFVDRGYTAVKLRVGDTPKRDAERVARVRREFGDELDIAVDAQTRYTAVGSRGSDRVLRGPRRVLAGGAVRARRDRHLPGPRANGPSSPSRRARTTTPGKSSGGSWKRARSPSCRPTAPRRAASRRSRKSPTWRPRGTSGPRPIRATRC